MRQTVTGVQFVLTDFRDGETSAELVALFPHATVHVTRPTLRDAFVAHARNLRADAVRTRGAA